eukprot:NODE_484_length_7802_cov_0.227184.p3 type:complete len:175 gc:universal NODE_484_length_7802_cov_0.227184:1068-1592(+)
MKLNTWGKYQTYVMKETSSRSQQYKNPALSTQYSSFPKERQVRRETSVRTLFIRNVDYNITEDDIVQLFSKYGEIKRSFFLIEKRGIAFVTFYDIRSAEHAIKDLKNYKLGNRIIEVHYSTPKGNTEQNRCHEDDNQATLFLTLSGNLNISQIVDHFSQFGELLGIRNLKVNYN